MLVIALSHVKWRILVRYDIFCSAAKGHQIALSREMENLSQGCNILFCYGGLSLL